MSPKTAQDSPKMAHGSWQSCCSSPSCSPRGLRVQLRGPRSTQDGSKTPQDGSKTPQDCPKMGPREAKPIFSHAPRGIDNPPGTCTDTGLGAGSFRKRHPGLPTAKSSSKRPKTGTKNDPTSDCRFSCCFQTPRDSPKIAPRQPKAAARFTPPCI